MQIPSISVLLQWPTANYDDPDTAGPGDVIAGIVTLVATTVMLGIRIYTRCRITHSFGIDDILALLAYAFIVVFTILALWTYLRLHWNRHIWDIEYAIFPKGLKLMLIVQICFGIANILTKISFLALILRITAASGQRVLRRWAMGLMAFLGVVCVVYVLLEVLQCRPLLLYWTISFSAQNCLSEGAIILQAFIVTMVYDVLATVFFPLPFCNAAARAAVSGGAASAAAVSAAAAEARMTAAAAAAQEDTSDNKTSVQSSSSPSPSPMTVMARLRSQGYLHPVVLALLAGNVIVVVAGALRIYVMCQALNDPRQDIIWGWNRAFLTCCVELNAGLIVASLPGTRPFAVRFFGRFMRTGRKEEKTRCSPQAETSPDAAQHR